MKGSLNIFQLNRKLSTDFILGSKGHHDFWNTRFSNVDIIMYALFYLTRGVMRKHWLYGPSGYNGHCRLLWSSYKYLYLFTAICSMYSCPTALGMDPAVVLDVVRGIINHDDIVRRR